MLIQGNSTAQVTKVLYLESLGLSSEQAHSLKRLQEVDVDNDTADVLLQNGLAKVIKVDSKPKKVYKPKPVVEAKPIIEDDN